MKKVLTGISFVFFILICSNSLNANPIRIGFFNELLFDSSGWKLELTMRNAPDDSLSLKGWFIVSGKDTAYFRDWMYLKSKRTANGPTSNYLVVTKDSLTGCLDLSLTEDTLYLYSPGGSQMDHLIYGPKTFIPSLKQNQSICSTLKTTFFDEYKYYFDDSPTIGARNDSVGATAVLKGYVVDAAGKTAANIEVGDYYGGSTSRPGKTDSTGHFRFDNWLASRYTLYFLRKDNSQFPYQLFTLYFQPGETKDLEFKLDWVINDNSQVQDVEKKLSTSEMKYSLDQNYPNPFNPSTSISYSVLKAGRVTLKVYNLLGNEVAILVSEYKNAGVHKATFDASMLPSGVYIYTIQSGEFRSAKKMTVLK
ncbi:MAG TPA: T9SS type A sorting domain-containing protein [Ignavibacteriales bacterium]|nr:T9SS type A sorting domain-containing protein [Ignavibacteriales bacterium]